MNIRDTDNERPPSADIASFFIYRTYPIIMHISTLSIFDFCLCNQPNALIESIPPDWFTRNYRCSQKPPSTNAITQRSSRGTTPPFLTRRTAVTTHLIVIFSENFIEFLISSSTDLDPVAYLAGALTAIKQTLSSMGNPCICPPKRGWGNTADNSGLNSSNLTMCVSVWVTNTADEF